MRKVMVSTVKQLAEGTLEYKEKGEATFLQFGVSYDLYSGGAAHYSTAIIQWPDGLVENVFLQNIRFI